MNDDVVTSIETSAMTLAWIPHIIAGLVLVLQAPLGPCARVFDPSPKSLKWTALPTSRGRVFGPDRSHGARQEQAGDDHEKQSHDHLEPAVPDERQPQEQQGHWEPVDEV